uniref:p95 protein n=1 Tax=Fopius arisanus TaxID=64838 RepID=A0A0C9PL99_9HYME
MDGYFLILCIVCMITILFYYILNIVPNETDPIKLFLMIQDQDYDARAFTLRYDKKRHKYENYFLSSGEANYKKSFDAYPVDKTGNFITTVYDNHGDLKYDDINGGYKILGVNTSFPCPDGYEGKLCQLKPLCRNPEDNNAKLPLSDTQFNELGIFRNDTQLTLSRQRRKRKIPLYHNRIYIQCKTKGKYDLIACPTNKLLDVNMMRCDYYDVCEDHLNGYKHNYQINTSDSPLLKNEYYLCVNNKSERVKCADDTVFSLVNNGCIQENICYNKKNATLPIDANNYIQCNNDQGVKKHCASGVVTLEDGALSCKTQNTCTPHILKEITNMLTYNYGRIKCTANDEEQLITCDYTLNKRQWKYNWGADFTIDIDWPKKILDIDNDQCVEPTDSIITNSIMKIKWSPLMREMWDWDIIKECFICPNGNYVWDYDNNVLRQNKDGKWLTFDENTVEYKTADPSFPCHETLGYEMLQNIWWEAEFIGRPYRFCVAPALSGSYNACYWPIKINLDSGIVGYRVDICQYDDKRNMNIIEIVSDKPPFGFKETVEKNNLLELLNGESIPKENPNDFVWWSIAAGKFSNFTFISPTITKTHTISSPQNIDITQNQTFTILFNLYLENQIEPINNELGCSRNGLYKYEISGDFTSNTSLIVKAGFIVFEIINSQLKVDYIEPLTLTNNLQLK